MRARQQTDHRRRAGIATVTAAAAFCAATFGLPAPPAWAFSGGITGVSGRQANTCAECHSGGVAPLVRFVGPTALEPGATATYRFEVEALAPTQSQAGFNVSANAGSLDILPGQDARRAQNGELTHNRPAQTVAALASWDLTWTAPGTPGIYTLFGAGNSVNGNRQPSGDRSSATTLDVAVGAAASPTPTPTVTPRPPAPSATSTATPARPAATFTPGGCAGDCDGSGAVAVNELIVGVNIALGTSDVGACIAIDRDGNGAVEINELIGAVNAALSGCGANP